MKPTRENLLAKWRELSAQRQAIQNYISNLPETKRVHVTTVHVIDWLTFRDWLDRHPERAKAMGLALMFKHGVPTECILKDETIPGLMITTTMKPQDLT